MSNVEMVSGPNEEESVDTEHEWDTKETVEPPPLEGWLAL